MSRTFPFIVLFVVCGLGPRPVWGQSPYAGLPLTHHFSSETYQGGIQNWQLAQDSLGILYVANNFGLLQYDGTNWSLHVVPNGTKVRSLALGEEGKIYLGCQGDFGYFSPNAQGRLEFTSLADQLPAEYRNFDETWRVYVAGGKVYFCTFQTIFIYEQGQFTIIQPEHTLAPAFFVDQTLYVRAMGYGLCKVSGQALELVPDGEFFRDQTVSGMLSLPGNGLLVAAQDGGLFQRRNGRFLPWSDAVQEFLSTAIINCMIQLRDGRIALGTQTQGLLVLSPQGELLLHLTKERGLENRTVLSLYQDQLENLWVGMNNGLSYVELGSPFSVIDEKMGLPGTGYAALLHQETLYLGTNNGLFVGQPDPLSGLHYDLVPGTLGQAYHISVQEEELLLGHHQGSYRIEEGVAELISEETGGWVFQQMPSATDRMIGGTYSGLVHYQKNGQGRWEATHKLEGLNESSRIMAPDPGYNALWMTHGYKGVYRIRLSPALDSIRSVSYYGEEDGFPSRFLINVHQLRDGLVFTSEAGTYRYDPDTDRFVPHPVFTELLGPDYRIVDLAEDVYGNVFFIGKQEIGMLRRNSMGGFEVERGIFTKVRYLLNDDLVNVTILENNEVVFGAKEGFVHYDPVQYKSYEESFPTLIRQVSASRTQDSTYYIGSVSGTNEETQVKLPYRENSLNFTFSAPFFEGLDRMEYSFLLESFDTEWSEWSGQTEKEYTNLPEGNYTFRVRSRNPYGMQGDEVSYAFIVTPPWFRSTLAYVSYSLGVLGILILGFMFLDKRHRKEKEVMALRQEAQLNEKNTELQSMAERTEAEITRLNHEKLEAEIRHKNKELATSTMHLMNKNTFISGVKGNLSSLSKKSNNQAVVKELNKLVRDIDKNLADHDDWEHFQFHFDEVHGDFSQRIKERYTGLTAQEMRLCAYLRLNLNTKEIAQLLNISVRGVEISRYRLRKKLELDRNDNLQEFILGF
ncbi:MAG: triple tyrosine motif-containing protein [Bacteroidota bacterium]